MNISPVKCIRHLLVAIFFALLVAVLLVTPAFADGETPPPPDTGTEVTSTDGTAEVAPTVEETPVVDPAPVDETAPVDQTTTEETAPANEATATEVTPLNEATATDEAMSETITAVDEAIVEAPVSETTDTTTADLLATLPEGTDLVVVNADGEQVPLASDEATEIIAVGDPIWCPSGVAPKALTNGCSDSFGSILLLYNSGFIPTGSGTIWVQYGTALADVTIDGNGAWAAAKNFGLTILGGWNGTPGSTGLYAADPTSTFATELYILNWVGNITLKNLIFNNVNNTYALRIETKGNIAVDKVQVNNTTGSIGGASLNNSLNSGIGTVSITNSSFKGNGGTGLYIFSNNTVTLKYVQAYGNSGTGVSLSTAKSTSVSNSSFTGNTFVGGDGLNVLANGTVTLTNISATLNANDGVEVTNWYTGVYPVYVNGVNDFSLNGQHGLNISSYGTIKVSNTTANNNGAWGASLANYSSPASSSVTIAGFLTAIDNGGGGVGISTRGSVTAANLTANGNGALSGAAGVYINNTYGSPKPVTISGYNVFNNNRFQGLQILSHGTVTLYNLTAINNGFTDYSGVEIDNTDVAHLSSQPSVSIYGNSFFWNNSLDGLKITSYGTVTLNNITAVNNGFGATNIVGNGVWIYNRGGTYPKGVNITGVNVFTYNDDHGAFIRSDGAITVSKVTANYNRGGGAFLGNSTSTVQSKVVISGYGIFEHNGTGGGEQWGLGVLSRGAITLANINANYNSGTGASLANYGITSPVPVTLTGVNNFLFNGNAAGESGLGIETDGKISLNKITASHNFDYGALLDNSSSTTNFPTYTPGGVVITGFGNFIGNITWDGLNINSHGTVTLYRITSNVNGDDGIQLFTTGSATLLCSNLYVNDFGLYGTIGGTLTLKGVLIYGNGINELFGASTVVRSTCPL
jgi:hypothetical protein